MRLPGAKIDPKSNDAGITPTTVTGASSSVSVRPTIPGSDAKRRTHSPWLSSTTFGPFHLHSSAVNCRPSCGSHTQQREEILRHRHAAEPLRLALPGEFVVAHAIESHISGEIGERLILLAQIQQMPHLRGLAGQAVGLIVIGQPDQLAGIAKRQRTQQQRVHHAEDGGTGADAEADNQNRKGSETGIAPQRAKGIGQVLEQSIQSRQAAGFAMQFARRFDAAERSKRAAASFFRRHALADILVDGHLQVSRQLGIEIAIHFLRAEK